MRAVNGDRFMIPCRQKQSYRVNLYLFTFNFSLFGRKGFTLLEVLISLAIIAGLLVPLLYTLNYHLGIAGRHEIITSGTLLAKEKMYEMEKNPLTVNGNFREPYSGFSYETGVRESRFPGILEISVVVRNGDEEISLRKLIIAKTGNKQIS